MSECPIRGLCLFMCPAAEIEISMVLGFLYSNSNDHFATIVASSRRQREGLVHKLETRSVSKGHNVPDRRKMVKMFTRSAAGKDLTNPEDLRSAPVLKKTVNYLLSIVASESREPWEYVYSFITDRLRSVRQDMIVQQTPPAVCLSILQPVVRFHVYSAYRLCEHPSDVFDAHLNRTQLNECLKQLLVCYDTVAGDTEGELSPEREQMEALYGLLHLGNVDALYRLLTLRPPKESLLRTVLKMSLAHFHNNYYVVCRTLPLLPPLLACVTALHLPHIRRKSLSIMNSAYSSKNLYYPLHKLKTLLLYTNETEAANECCYYGLTVDGCGVHFSKGIFNSSIQERPCKRSNFIDESLQNISLPELLLTCQ